ncbi:MAG: trypsin-like serine protease [Myxococcales bacterium]|nr:trypsin-like serine protease [Myxococcales bacterium]
MQFRARAWTFSFVAVLALGCGSPDGGASREVAAIISGAVDTSNQAVVAIQGAAGACSGTIIAKQDATGYVLTAASCTISIDPTLIVQGDDISAPGAIGYRVAEWQAHPMYDDGSREYNFALLKFTGATAATPMIAVATPAEDTLASGDTVALSGYGVTSVAGEASTQRRSVQVAIDQVTDLQLLWSQASGGACSGDTGGPALNRDGDRVVGVISHGDIECNAVGVAGRPSAVFEDFIEPNVGAPTPTDAGNGSSCAVASGNPGHTPLIACVAVALCLAVRRRAPL